MKNFGRVEITSTLADDEWSAICQFKMFQSLFYEYFLFKVRGVNGVISYSTQNMT